MIRIINDVFALKIVMMPSIFRITAIAFLFTAPFMIYFNKDKEQILHVIKKEAIPKVLILAQGRSGSTFLGSIMSVIRNKMF